VAGDSPRPARHRLARHLLRQAGAPELTSLSASSIPMLLAAVSAATVGAVLASRRPRHPVGWLLLGVGLSLVAHDLTFGYTRYGLVARPGTLPAAGYLAGFNNGVVLSWIACAGFVLLLTPTGSLPSPRWRWWARVAAVAPGVWLLASVVHPTPLYPEYPAIGNPLAVPAVAGPLPGAVTAGCAVVVLAALVVGAVSLVGRFRRARGVERQQLRWLALAAALAAMALLLAIAALVLEDSGSNLLNVIISRTLTYGLLTMLLGLGYATVVLSLGLLLPNDSSLVVAAATLTVAAVFQPARRRLQHATDRRFNRRRYHAAATIATFSARLRQQVDLDTLTAELLAVVDQTMQPTSVSLWLRRTPQA
jgi:hypothetical protein